MIGNSGLFLNISCPMGNYCDRSYCQFQHSSASTLTPPSHQPNNNAETTASKNIVISQEESVGENCYMGYMGSVEPSKSNMSSTTSLPSSIANLYSFDYSNAVKSYDPMLNYSSYSAGQGSMFSNFQTQQSLYAPEDPVFSSVHQISTASTACQSYVPSYQSVDIGSEFSQSYPLKATRNNSQQYRYEQLTVSRPQCNASLTNSAKGFQLSNSCRGLSRKREISSPVNDAAMPIKRVSFPNQNSNSYSGSSKLLKKPQTSVYVPTPIAELERQKNNLNKKKLLREKSDQTNDGGDKGRIRAVPRNRSPAAENFSVIPKVPIDLADDEILNPAKRIPPPVQKANVQMKKETTLNVATGRSKEMELELMRQPKEAVKAKLSGVTTSNSGSVPIKKLKTIADSKSIVNKNLSTKAQLLRGSASIFAKRTSIDSGSDSDNKSASAFKKVNQQFAELERYKAKQDRLNHLNATARAIADIDQKIAEKERVLRAAISGPKKRDDVVWNKAKKSNELNSKICKPAERQFDIDSLFEDVEQTLDKTEPKQQHSDSSVVEDTDDCIIFHPSVKKKFEPTKLDHPCTSTRPMHVVKSVSMERCKQPVLQPKRPVLKKPKLPNAVEQMKNRFAVLSDAVSSPNTSKDVDSGFGKGETRKARVGTFPTLAQDKKLAPLDMFNTKIAYSVRTKYLERIYAEYKKISANDEEAINQAVREEKIIIDKSPTRPAYASSIANLIRRIRECSNSSSTVAEHGISHQEVLAGKHFGSFSVGIRRAEKVAARSNRISEARFYDILAEQYLLTEEQLSENSFPRWVDANQQTLVSIQSYNPSSTKHGFVDDAVLSRICNRCGKGYRLSKDGEYLAQDNTCVFHWGKAWKKRSNGVIESRYTCCDQDLSVKGCVIGDYHVTETQRRQTLSDFAETPPPCGVGDPRSRKVYALDCEMVYSVWGPILARLSVVDIVDDLVLDKIILPQYKVVDPNTRFSGLTMEQLNNAKCTFEEAKERLFELVNRDTILIGHSLESDLKALRIVHSKVVDTSVVFPHRLGPPKKRALKTITLEILQKIIQEDVNGHDSKEDASACMKIMLSHVEKLLH